MIPIGNDVPVYRTPWVTLLILAVLLLVWIVVQGAGLDEVRLVASLCNLGLVPGELTGQAPVGEAVPVAPGLVCVVDREPINAWTPLLSMFLHGSWGHLLGNGLFLWVFGKAVEDAMGYVRYALFYLLCGLAAAAAQVAIAPASPVPMVGASGAIAGVLGGFLLLHPRARVRILFILFIFLRIIELPAAFVLLWWAGWQLIAGLPQLMTVRPEISSGVAVWAHIGGFATGALLVRLFARRDRDPRGLD
jgi:membrane associated rhomboid family serine protease